MSNAVILNGTLCIFWWRFSHICSDDRGNVFTVILLIFQNLFAVCKIVVVLLQIHLLGANTFLFLLRSNRK